MLGVNLVSDSGREAEKERFFLNVFVQQGLPAPTLAKAAVPLQCLDVTSHR